MQIQRKALYSKSTAALMDMSLRISVDMFKEIIIIRKKTSHFLCFALQYMWHNVTSTLITYLVTVATGKALKCNSTV